MRYAIVSVYEKEGVEKIAVELKKKGYNIISTGGTSKYLAGKGIETVDISDLTSFPEILDGRVKTLHPLIFGGILARRFHSKDIESLKELEIPLIDVVVVNFYPFEEHREDKIGELLEFIDIGGPSLVRAAAKNYRDVLVVTDPEDYEEFVERLTSNEIDEEYRKYLALKAFEMVARYDILIFDTLKKKFSMDTDRLFLSLRKHSELRYGENPHQKGWAYLNELENRTFLREVKKLWGKELSYNNILDAHSAWKLLLELDPPACVIVKHNNPCGAAEARALEEAYKRALEGDPVSAFGGIVAFSGKVTPGLAEELNKIFLEIIIAPEYDEEALKILKKKKKRRLLEVPLTQRENNIEFRWVDGDFLVEEEDRKVVDMENLQVVCGEVDEETLNDLIFAFKVVKHVRSNAIVVAKQRATLGIGAGQMNRVQSARIALENAGDKAKGAVLASDGFFPFTDSIELASEYGIKAIIQPGGSIRDKEVIEATKKLGLAMVFTGIRHFRH